MHDYLDDEAPDRTEPRFGPDPACPKCGGRGWLRTARGMEECTCLLRRRVLHYLTPLYSNPAIGWDHGFDPTPLLGQDVRVEREARQSDTDFAASSLAVVKSFLLCTAARLSHRTVTPHEVMQRYLSNQRNGGLDELERPDLVVLLFDVDPPNRAYPEVLRWLMVQRRRVHGRATWALTHHPPTSGIFKGRYGGEVADHLLASFTKYVRRGV